jgi:hypothetical protein
VDTYKKILTRQSEAEGRGDSVIVGYDEEKFFFESGISRPLFISHMKKSPGISGTGKSNS